MVGKTDNADSLFSKIEKIVKDVQASSLASEKLGKKQLAYPIKKQTEAEYFLFNFEAPGESVRTISESLRLEQEAVLRYLITKIKERKSKKGIRRTEEAKVAAPENTDEENESISEVKKAKPRKTIVAKFAKVKVRGKGK